MLEGVVSVTLHYITAHEQTQCSLLPKDLHSELILFSLKLVLCHVVVVKCLPVHHHSEDHIFWSFGIIGLILSQFENRVPLEALAVLHHYITAH